MGAQCTVAPTPKLPSSLFGTCSEAGMSTNYAAEGRLLLERMHLKEGDISAQYCPANAIYRHPETGAALYVGNERFATSKTSLAACGIRRIVFCQDGPPGDGKMAFASDPTFKYLPFAIGRWRQHRHEASTVWKGGRFFGDALSSTNAVRIFFAPLFDFVAAELGAGEPVLIHCLAGAHRAGTAGIACLMRLCTLNREEATAAAQTARPVIRPIGDFPLLLKALEDALRETACAEQQTQG